MVENLLPVIMKVRDWFRYDKLLHPDELFKGFARIFVSYLARYYTNTLHIFREYFKNARYNFTIDKVKWEQNTEVLLYLSTYLYSAVYGKGEYEKDEINFLKRTLKEGDVFIDVGANVGLYTLVAGKLVGSSGIIFAFEPSKREYELLNKNIILNKLNNVKPIKIALSNYNGVAKFLVAGGKDTTTNTLARTFYGAHIKFDRVEEVEVYKMDDFIHQLRLNKITGIKIDVEGHDIFLLEGAKQILGEFKPFLMLEVSEQNLRNTGCNSKQMFDLLKSYNYEIFYYDEKGRLTTTPPAYIYEPNRLYYDIVCFHKRVK